MRPNLLPEVTRRIVGERRRGMAFQAIADGLMDDGMLTSRGRKTWYSATIKAVVESDNASRLLSELGRANLVGDRSPVAPQVACGCRRLWWPFRSRGAARNLSRSSSDMPPQMPNVSGKRSECSRHSAVTGQSAQMALAFRWRALRAAPRSASG